MPVAAFNNFRKNLATVIEVRQIKKKDFAEAAKTSRSYVDSVLKGDTEPLLTQAEKLARAAKLPLITLLLPEAEFSEAVLTTVRS